YLKGGYPFPKHWLTSISAMFVAGHIANTFFERDPNFSHLAGFIENSIQNKHLTKDPYSVSRDPIFDKRLSELKKRWTEIKEIERNKRGGEASQHFYDLELIDKHKLDDKLNDLDPKDADYRAGNDKMDKA